MQTNTDTLMAGNLDRRQPTDVASPCLIATFWLGSDFFGIDIEWVQEILRAQEMTPVPLAPEYVAGLINLRGQIIMALHLKKLIYNQTLTHKTDSMNLVVRHDEDVISLLIDEVGDVLELNRDEMLSVPPTVTTIKAAYLRGVYPLNDRLLLVLNMERVLTLS